MEILSFKSPHPFGRHVFFNIHGIREAFLQQKTDGAPSWNQMSEEFFVKLSRILRVN
jgi:hypothetical protein